MNFLWFLIVGALAGWLAGKFMKGSGFGLLVNIVVGIVGGVLGGWLFGLIGMETEGIIGSIITAFVGACLFLFVLGKVKN